MNEGYIDRNKYTTVEYINNELLKEKRGGALRSSNKNSHIQQHQLIDDGVM